MISIAQGEAGDIVFLPSRLNRQYLEQALSRSLGRDIAIAGCTTTNLCRDKHGGVSNSGATVLRLSLELRDGPALDLVAKILCPDAVNVNKPDCHFDSRVAEVAWAEWWSRQGVPWVPVVYDVRSDVRAREFWITQEWFPQIGWPGWAREGSEGMGEFSSSPENLRALFRQVAALHAHSNGKIQELLQIFAPEGLSPGGLCPPSVLVEELERVVQDAPLRSSVGVNEDECRWLETYCAAVRDRPEWVDEWDIVCVTADWRPDNFGMRDLVKNGELVTFDWGTTRLAPMEEDLAVLLMRIRDESENLRRHLLTDNLEAYADKTGHEIEYDEFMRRLPWATFFVTLRYLLGHVACLRWVPFQTRSRDFVHLFIGLCKRQLEECRRGRCN